MFVLRFLGHISSFRKGFVLCFVFRSRKVEVKMLILKNPSYKETAVIKVEISKSVNIVFAGDKNTEIKSYGDENGNTIHYVEIEVPVSFKLAYESYEDVKKKRENNAKYDIIHGKQKASICCSECIEYGEYFLHDDESLVYRITYVDCRKIIDSMDDSVKSDTFGIEKTTGKVEGIITTIYQSVFGGDVYPSLEEKAANLLYFMIKDHPFVDGCKRIASSLFLEFLNRNNAIFMCGEKVMSEIVLVDLTHMIAKSDSKEKDIMIALVMSLISV